MTTALRKPCARTYPLANRENIRLPWPENILQQIHLKAFGEVMQRAETETQQLHISSAETGAITLLCRGFVLGITSQVSKNDGKGMLWMKATRSWVDVVKLPLARLVNSDGS